MTPLKILDDWAKPVIDATGVQVSYGPFPDGPEDAQTRWATLSVTGSGMPGPIQRYPQITLALFGRRDEPGDMLLMYEIALALLDLSDSDDANGCAMLVRPLGDPVGPGTTEHGRAFWILNFEVAVGKN